MTPRPQNHLDENYLRGCWWGFKLIVLSFLIVMAIIGAILWTLGVPTT